MQYDVIIVGAGISGATIAERYANLQNKKVLVIEKRDHIGGNCFDYYDDAGLLVSKYGAHIFHTNHDDVWEYVNKFTEWRPYYHTVLSSVEGKLVPIPVNITTVNMLFGLHIQTEEEMKEWLNTQTEYFEHPQNSEESALARVGQALYEKLFKTYTIKQWDTSPTNLAASILERIPVRTDFDPRYFTDKYQGIPTKGYTEIFKNMLNNPNITVMLNTDYFDIKDTLGGYEKLFFTGPIDLFFSEHSAEKLQYRSIRFEFETLDRPYFQVNSVINYPNDNEFTRIVEFKHLYGQEHEKTTICREYPTWDGEPYYPVLSKQNLDLYEFYKEKALSEEKNGVHFVGRLANYKYFNMDQAFKNALDLFHSLNP